MSETADWSGLPRDLYVTSVRRIDNVVWEATMCSVPMAIGPEVRYSLVPDPEFDEPLAPGELAHPSDSFPDNWSDLTPAVQKAMARFWLALARREREQRELAEEALVGVVKSGIYADNDEQSEALSVARSIVRCKLCGGDCGQCGGPIT